MPMKTTIDIADRLAEEARRPARRDRTTLRALVEEGLRLVLRARRSRPTPYRWKPVGFRGRGLQPGIREGDWDGIRARLYERRGG